MTDSGNSAAPGGSILESRTPIFGQKLDVIIFVTVVIALAVFLVIFFYLRDRRSKKPAVGGGKSSRHLPFVCKESKYAEENPAADGRNKVFLMGDVVKGIFSDTESKMGSSDSKDSSSLALSASTDGLGGSFYWGRWYSLTELQMATDHFSGENVVGEGGYGIVYRGVLPDGTVVAVKHLLNKKGQAEKDLKVEVDAIGKVKHKNLVSLIGYCVEGTHRLLVYEYVDNGNLEQWLHGEVGPVSPLTWEIRMRIAIGTARGLAYLHEGLEPKVVHRDVKSSNILLDKKWNPKVSDFGLAKLLGSEISYVTTRVMGTFGYVSPDYASTGMLNEGNDVYSFGVLLMEIVTGRQPVDYAKPPGEMNLVDWFKGMVAGRRVKELVDPLMDVPPSTRALTRILLICLRCVDLDAHKRPKMGQIVNMLEGDEFPHRAEIRPFRETSHLLPMLLEDDNKMQKAVMNDDGGRYMERMMIRG